MPSAIRILFVPFVLVTASTACPGERAEDAGSPAPSAGDTLAGTDTGTAAAPDADAAGARDTAYALVRDARGDAVGEIVLAQTAEGVTLRGDLTGLPPGVKGFHIHETGTCEGLFESAGGHFNPNGREHGLENPAGPHAGDLPNLQVPNVGVATVEVTAVDATLGEGSTGLFDSDGSAVVVHRNQDDMRTDPAGNSGPRIACGVVTRERARG